MSKSRGADVAELAGLRAELAKAEAEAERLREAGRHLIAKVNASADHADWLEAIAALRGEL